MKILYYDCFAGISGDMHLGAMIDLGVDLETLKMELLKLPVHGYELNVTREMRKGISGTRVQVLIDEHHSHDHHYGHHHHGNHHHHHHNSFSEIRQMILSSSLEQGVKDMSISILTRVAEAEAAIHNTSVEDVQFHEVGAIDSIVDIVGAAICIKNLAPDVIMGSTVELGGGSVTCAHGTYPVPAPATASILAGIPVKKGAVDYEATTPTGAAILAACVNEFSDRARFTMLKTGYGIGAKDFQIPNVLRVFLGNVDITGAEQTQSFIIECNIDDMNPEFYDYIVDSLFAAGANDVFITPIIMKKSRPAVTLSVLCTAAVEMQINEVLFKETSTLGVRKYLVEKSMLDRKMRLVQTQYGEVRVKSAFYQGKTIKTKPEYDDCMKIARDRKIPISQVYHAVEQALGRKIDTND